MEADRERRIGRLEGRQEMLLEWVTRLEQDLQRLRDRLADEGVLDYMEEVDTMQSNIESLKRKIEGEDFDDNDGGIFGYFSQATSSRRRVISNIVLMAVIALFLVLLTWLLIALAQNDIRLPFLVLRAEWAVPLLPTLRRSQLRSFALLYEQEPQDAPTSDDHEEEQKRVHRRK